MSAMRAFQVFIFSVFCMSLGCAYPGATKNRELNIVGGNATDISEVPYQVAMVIGSDETLLLCGGSIISKNFIMTAAHCCAARRDFSFRLGSSFYSDGGVVIKVKEIYIHPQYSEDGFLDYDICLVETDTEIKYEKNIQPIPAANDVPQPNTPARVSGWGVTEDGSQIPSRQLLSVVVPICNQTYCQKAYTDANLKRFICAGVEGKDSCQGDSGGPLTVDGKAVGIVSYGFGCAEKGYPGVYTSVAQPEIRSFIKKIANV